MKLREGKTFKPVGRCIYCGSVKGTLSKEHIIPYSLGGNLVLPKASCSGCATVTAKFERTCARGIFGNLRIRLDMPSRNPDIRPQELATVLIRNGEKEEIKIPARKFPATCIGIRFSCPGILSGKEPSSFYEKAEWVVRTYKDDYQSFLENPGDGILLGKMNPYALCKLLAKIAHAYAVAQIGYNGFRHYLPDIILGKSDKHAYFIGGDTDPDDPPQTQLPVELHTLKLGEVPGTLYLIVTIQLFRYVGMPRYHVIVGEGL